MWAELMGDNVGFAGTFQALALIPPEPELGSCKMGAAGSFPEGDQSGSEAEMRDGERKPVPDGAAPKATSTSGLFFAKIRKVPSLPKSV